MSGVYIISAPSGSGKSTLVDRVRQIVPGLKFSISYTTRAPRAASRMAANIISFPRAEFEEMIRRDEFLEYADVFGNYYGTARRFQFEAEEEGKDLLLDIDVQGAAQIKRKIPDGGKHLHSASQPAGTGEAVAHPQSGCGRGDPAPVGHGLS